MSKRQVVCKLAFFTRNRGRELHHGYLNIIHSKLKIIAYTYCPFNNQRHSTSINNSQIHSQ